MTYEGGARKVSCRVDVIRNGVPFTTLQPVEPPQVVMDTAAEIKKRMSGTFRPNEKVDFFTDWMRPVLILDGVESPVGDFYFSTVTERWENGAITLEIEAFDQSLILQQITTENFLYFAANVRYDYAISTLLQQAGVSRVIFEPTDAVLTTEREDWEPGTPYLEIVNALLSEIGYDPVWFDAKGVARLGRYRPPEAANITHFYEEGVGSFVLPYYERSLDLFNAPNVFKVAVENPEYSDFLYATAENDSLSSALSIPRRGRRIVAPTVLLDNIADQKALQEYVDRIKYDAMKGDEFITFQTGADPTHEVGDIVSVSVNDRKLSGIYAETSWTLTLGPGVPMEHTARRTVFIS